jgi:enoyl-CoA hydratase/carnithine racemase
MQLPASLQLERDGDVAIVRLARVAKRNALDDETIRGIEALFCDLPEGVRAVVLSARGEHFSAGLDLAALVDATPLEALQHSQRWYRTFELIQYAAVPVIAALHGAVIGGGLELAAAAHIRVADTTAYYALPEGRRGIFLGGGGSVRITRLIGAARTMDLMLTGRIYTAEDGQQAGISQYLVAAGGAEARALELAHGATALPPLSLYGILQTIPRNAEAAPETGYLLENLTAALAAADPAAQQRIADFLAGRAAKVR